MLRNTVEGREKRKNVGGEFSIESKVEALVVLFEN